MAPVAQAGQPPRDCDGDDIELLLATPRLPSCGIVVVVVVVGGADHRNAEMPTPHALHRQRISRHETREQ